MKKLKFLDIIMIFLYLFFLVATLNGEKLEKLYPYSIYFIVFIVILLIIYNCITLIKEQRYRTRYLILLCEIVCIVSLLILFYYYKAMPPFQDNPTPEYLDKVITIGAQSRKYKLLATMAFLMEGILKMKKFEIKKDYNIEGEKNEQYH